MKLNKKIGPFNVLKLRQSWIRNIYWNIVKCACYYCSYVGKHINSMLFSMQVFLFESVKCIQCTVEHATFQ
jgi:hypothetical protein